jgi:diadenosine tetraphosphate (Ap4A) HIT family hydrolase
MRSCIFCEIAKERKILYTDELITVFHSIHRDAHLHLLIISNRHIESCNNLQQSDMPLLEHMRDIAMRIVTPFKKRVCIGFHQPPFVSVPHLHLHVVIQPKLLHAIKYIDYTPWFISLDRFIRVFFIYGLG